MRIGDRYADNKLYRGIKHYDSMPLTSGDLHETSDTNYMKNAYIMNNLLGYGTLNTPTVQVSAEGLRLSEPSVVMIDGDVSLIQSDDNQPLVTLSDIETADISSGVVCILGWYQHITDTDTIRSYGGVDNSELDNDIKDSRFPTAISSRYQFRWFTVIVEEDSLLEDSISIRILNRDKTGAALSRHSNLTSIEKVGNVFIFSKPTSMSYASSDLYLVPILAYQYSGGAITGTYAWDKLRSGYPFINSESEPTGIIPDGARWYNPTTKEFKTYVGGEFVDSASKMAFLQYQSIYLVTEETATTPTHGNVDIPIGINSFQEGDILRVIYEGLELAVNLNYTINYSNATVKLLDFTTQVGDTIYFTVTRVVEATDITNVTETFVRHMSSRGSATVEAHVKLSDTLSNSDATQGIAATPKMVNSLKTELSSQITTLTNSLNILQDETTGVNYKIGVKDGNIYVEEV